MGNTGTNAVTNEQNTAEPVYWFGHMECCMERDHPRRATAVSEIKLVSRTDGRARNSGPGNSGGVAFITAMHGF